jgi:LysR family glycine cleavage system transcriptional activator
VTVPTSFASKWLLPRMDGFRAAQPQLDLRIDTTNRLADYAAEGIDLGVRYGFGNYPGFVCERLVGETLFPVCSPALLRVGGERLRPDELRALPLIHDQTIDFDPSYPDWRAWFASHGIDDVDVAHALHFNSSVLAVQAAVEGQGVALGRSLVVEDDLRAGRLVRPCDGELPARCAYYVLHLPDAGDEPAVRAVRDWLIEQFAPSVSTTQPKKT